MRLAHSLATVAAISPDQFEDLRRNIDPEWVVQALEATGTATLRSRRLPAEQVVWLVLGMALFRNRSIHDVVSKLDLALPGISPTVAPSSVAQARARLGPDPMEWLFAICAEHWAHASARNHPWRGLALYGVDGTTLRVPDSTDNAAYFGYSHSVRGESAYPMVRGVGLMALRSHLLAAVAFGPYAVLRRLGPRDELVELNVSREARRQDPSLPERWVARAVTYQRKGFRPQTLLTSLTDPATFPADEIATLYHERWELELGYDEIKTELLDREETIRSRTPTGVQQELWGIFLAYNLVRLEMERVASKPPPFPWTAFIPLLPS